ncbi:MAG: hypothetical protein V2J55_15195 [Candidatus Competibacteraceae bacterium]|jgi:hypothetical protein|nr:hypothetical protein [Candidatus Competibacteraceae bacterium]
MHVNIADDLAQGRPESELEKAVREGLLLHDYLNATISLGRFAELMGVSYTEKTGYIATVLPRCGTFTKRRSKQPMRCIIGKSPRSSASNTNHEGRLRLLCSDQAANG